jgi:hypothetical protein
VAALVLNGGLIHGGDLGNWKSENAGTVYVVKQGCHGIGN